MLTDKKILKSFYYGDNKKLNNRKQFWGKYGNNKISYNEFIISEISNLSEKDKVNILDIGCGLGDFLLLLKKKLKKSELHGIDISGSMVEAAKTSLGDQATIINGDITCNDTDYYKNYFFDYIFSLHVFHHIYNTKECIRKLMNYLKKDGFLIISFSRNNLNKGINKIHYEVLQRLNFPDFMLDKKIYSNIEENKIEKELDSLGLSYQKKIYINNAIVNDIDDILLYYKTAMMYRGTKGVNDKRITLERWEELENSIRVEIKKEIDSNGYVTVMGEIILYKISKGKKSE